MNDDKLDPILRKRAFEAPSEGFAARIISAAASTPQLAPPGIMDWLERMFSELQLPRPAYSFASILIVGALLGMNLPMEEAIVNDDDGSLAIQSFLYLDEEIL